MSDSNQIYFFSNAIDIVGDILKYKHYSDLFQPMGCCRLCHSKQRMQNDLLYNNFLLKLEHETIDSYTWLIFEAVDIGALKKSFLGDMDETSRSSVTSSTAPAPTPAPAPSAPGFHPTPMQESFQPSSTPVYLSHRYMVSVTLLVVCFRACHYVALCNNCHFVIYVIFL